MLLWLAFGTSVDNAGPAHTFRKYSVTFLETFGQEWLSPNLALLSFWYWWLVQAILKVSHEYLLKVFFHSTIYKTKYSARWEKCSSIAVEPRKASWWNSPNICDISRWLFGQFAAEETFWHKWPLSLHWPLGKWKGSLCGCDRVHGQGWLGTDCVVQA